MTDENVIFLQPIMTKKLNKIHNEFINYMKNFNGTLNTYYDIDKWMPHCTIAIRLNDNELFKTVKILKKALELPIIVKIDRIDVINYPNNQIYMDKI